MKLFRNEEGFTLVELMVVVLIIGILVAIAVPMFNAAKASAQTKSCFANQRTIEGAYQASSAAGNAPGTVAAGGTAGDSCQLVTGGFIKRWPVCPLASSGTTSTYAYGYDATGACLRAASCTHGQYRS